MKTTEVKFEAYDEKEADALFVEDEEELICEEGSDSSEGDWSDDVVEANMYFGMYRTLETKEGMRERFYGLGMPKNTDEERKVLLLEELDELAEYYIVHYDLEMLSNIALLRRQAKELFVELGVA